MPTRKERHRAERHRAILRAARELAEERGWDAVTTRRLAERIEYSQPVLYSHFPAGKDEIVAAVAVDGFTELAAELARATADAGDARGRLVATARTYLAFAAEHPAVYEAMFTSRTGLPFATEDTPEPLRAGFDALRGAVPRGDDVLVEVVWASLHGLATLTRAGRVPPGSTDARVERLVDLVVPPR